MTRAEVLTRSEVCAHLAISRWTLTRWVAAGKIPRPILPGRSARWDRAQIEALHAGVFRAPGRRTYFTKARQAEHERVQHLAALAQIGSIQ